MQISEQDFEDWVCEHIKEVVGDDDALLLAEQLELPEGTRLDVLALRRREPNTIVLVVIELKRDTIRASTVTQVMGYMGVLRAMVPLIRQEFEAIGEDVELAVEGLLVAPDITQDAIWCVSAVDALAYRLLGIDIDLRRSSTGIRYTDSAEKAGQHAAVMAGQIHDWLEYWRHRDARTAREPEASGDDRAPDPAGAEE